VRNQLPAAKALAVVIWELLVEVIPLIDCPPKPTMPITQNIMNASRSVFNQILTVLLAQ
jgi:hypothetical protein